MSSLGDKLRNKVNDFLNNGKTLEEKMVSVINDEADAVLEKYRPTINKILDDAMANSLAELKLRPVVIDVDKIRTTLQEAVELYVDEDEDEDIKLLLMEKVLDELKQCAILPSMNNEGN